MREAISKEARVHGDDAFALLEYLGAESAGSLVLLPPSRDINEPGGLRPLSDDDLAQRIRNLPRATLSSGAPNRYTTATLQTLPEIVEYCRNRVITRLSLYGWLVFNLHRAKLSDLTKTVDGLAGGGHRGVMGDVPRWVHHLSEDFARPAGASVWPSAWMVVITGYFFLHFLSSGAECCSGEYCSGYAGERPVSLELPRKA